MTRRMGSRAILCAAAVLAVWFAGAAAAHAQQTGTVQGLVIDGGTRRPIAGAQVNIQGTQIGMVTNEQGRFLLLNVPAGTHTLRVELLGYGTTTREVTVAEGQQSTVNFTLETAALQLGEIVVTGVSGGAVERAKVPFSVSRVDLEQMPVQAVNPLTQLQGRVPGANIASTTGRPGTSPNVILRGPTSINASGRGQDPLYILDGVVLGANLQDINPADIESVEIVKGAAASTLYGSRAAAGVISITTKRGTGDGVRFTARSEVGFNDIEGDFGIARSTPYLLDETGTRFCAIDPLASQNVCTRTIDYLQEQRRINNVPIDWALSTVTFPVDPGSGASGPLLRRTFLANQWPGRNYNAVQQIVDPKPLLINDFSMSGRVGSTNFFSSVGHTKQGGAFMGLEGYERLNARVNVGHRIGNDWAVDINSYVSRSTQDGSNFEESNTGFFRLTRVPAIVDITQRDEWGRLYIRPNLGTGGVQNQNPLYNFENTQREDVRWRYLIGGTVRYTPLPWLESDVNFSLDRMNHNFMQFNDKGFRTTNEDPATNEGLIFNGVNNNQSINTSAGVTLRPHLLDQINTRFNLGWHYEAQDLDNRNYQGNRLRVQGITSGQNATVRQSITGSRTKTRQMSFSAGTFLDFYDRYTMDLAVRRDGSSRFGEDHRWQTYGRASAAWLMSREDWFPTGGVSVFTLRGSYGTAGNSPNYNAQYELYNMTTGGVLSAQTLGNPLLRPEVVTEWEIGGDVELFNRYGLTLTYANSLAKDQILPVPVAVTSGFPTQWQNAGELRNKTWEAALTVPVVRNERISWNTRMNYTRNRAVVEKLHVPPFYIGTSLQATDAIIRVEEGVRYGTFYGRKFMTDCSELPAPFNTQCGGAGAAFQKNSDGYIVWVGQGNNPGMGLTHNLWNAVLPAAQAPYGVQASWGMPILVRNPDTSSPELLPLGNALPDYRLGMAHTVQVGRVSLYGLLEGAFGQSVWNQGRHWSYLDFLSRDLDQAGRTVEEAKPIGYYYRVGPGPGGHDNGIGGLYDILSPNNHMVEDASFVKLREVSASFNIGRIRNYGTWTLSVVGRNLKTWTDYRGFDPEVGVGNQATSDSGSGLINAIDAFTFPQLRTLSFVLGTTF